MNRYKNEQIENKKVIIRRLEQLLELLILAAMFFLFWRYYYRFDYFYEQMYLGRGKYVLIGLYAVILGMTMHLDEGFQIGYKKLFDIVILQWMSVVITNIVEYMQLSLIADEVIPVRPMVYLTLAEMPVCIIMAGIYTYYYHQMYVPMNMLMIYGTDNAAALKLKFDRRPGDKYHVEKLVSADIGKDALIEMIPNYDAVIISDIKAKLRNDILKFCYAHEIRTYLTPKISDIITGGSLDVTLFDTPLKLVKGLGPSILENIAKRFFDILLSLIALILLSPFMIGIAIAIKISDHGPVLYKQLRVTKNGKKFNILKFRSMVVDAEKNGEFIPATDGDPRITRVGKFIRGCRADELPQLINILKGDMSIVGPRPERVEHVEKYKEIVPEFICREKVKGGLTGYAQVYGKYNTTALDKLKLDLLYIENYNFLLDLKIILMTVRILFQKESTEGFDKVITEEDVQKEIEESLKHDD
jgi:exopolysaccharide biosynthesis polyprenyl glycosylphosphotransferase